MDKKEIEKKLKEEISKTEAVIEDYKKDLKPISPDNAIGRVSRMDAIINQQVTKSGLMQAQNKLDSLKNALSSINSEDFGMCKKCSTPIPLGRILIKPDSVYCVKCLS